MLPAAELRRLSLWCRRHGASWSPARSDEGAPALLLAPWPGAAAWPPLLLVEAKEGWRLIDGWGEQAATASRLGLLLDALDAGAAGGPIAGLGPAPRPDAVTAGW